MELKKEELLNQKIEDRRPVSVKSGVFGCVNCNTEGCIEGSKFEGESSCSNRVFAGEEELQEYVDSQY